MIKIAPPNYNRTNNTDDVRGYTFLKAVHESLIPWSNTVSSIWRSVKKITPCTGLSLSPLHQLICKCISINSRVFYRSGQPTRKLTLCGAMSSMVNSTHSARAAQNIPHTRATSTTMANHLSLFW